MDWLAERTLCAVFRVRRGSNPEICVSVTPQQWPYLENPHVRDELKSQMADLCLSGHIPEDSELSDVELVETLPDRMNITTKIAGDKTAPDGTKVKYYDITDGTGSVTRRAAIKDHYLRTGDVREDMGGARPNSLGAGEKLYDTYQPGQR